MAMLGSAAQSGKTTATAASQSERLPVKPGVKRVVKSRSDAPSLTALDRTAFAILGATTRDNRRRIVELAEERSLVLDGEICSRARSDLTNPRNRLTAEVAWLPGLSPKRANSYRALLKDNIATFMGSAAEEAPLVRANLLAAGIELFDPDTDAEIWTGAISDLADEVERFDPEEVLRVINEDRAVAGFPEIQDIGLMESELTERRRHYKETIKEAINRLHTSRMLDIVSKVVTSTTKAGAEHAPILVDELIDSFEAGVRPFLDKEGENILKLVKTANGAAPKGESVVSPLLDKLEQVLRNWDKVAKPIQVSLKARGIDHEPSKALAYEIRGLAVDLFNKHAMLEQAQRVTTLLQDIFSQLPGVADRLEQDGAAIDDIFKGREQAKRQLDEWAREITYEAQIGLVFKDTLRIGPNGIEWKNSRYALEAITRVRWGGVRQSSGTDYTIAFGDNRSEVVVQLRREEVYTTFLDKLWRAVCARLVAETLQALKAGQRLAFADALVDDNGVRLTRHRFLGTEEVHLPWKEVHYWSADGSLVIASQKDKKTYASISYLEIPNAHILESIIRLSFKKWKGRLSGLLDE